MKITKTWTDYSLPEICPNIKHTSSQSKVPLSLFVPYSECMLDWHYTYLFTNLFTYLLVLRDGESKSQQRLGILIYSTSTSTGHLFGIGNDRSANIVIQKMSAYGIIRYHRGRRCPDGTSEKCRSGSSLHTFLDGLEDIIFGVQLSSNIWINVQRGCKCRSRGAGG